MLLKKKKDTEKTSEGKNEILTESGSTKKQKQPPAQGSRFGAMILLVVTILISLGFFLWGRINKGDLMIDFGESSKTWEYKK